jgi:hypothetical protein
VRASATAGEAEAERVAASPFLYARLRTRISAEEERRAGGETWLALLGVVWRSVPAMALVALFAFRPVLDFEPRHEATRPAFSATRR